ncbi:MAG: exo-alpha-sialidase [Candidatus Heimdallarchaeota archaeon]|nr:exo-alpha-sialidase [Candidatus Heimdallarchaeota archaeon]
MIRRSIKNHCFNGLFVLSLLLFGFNGLTSNTIADQAKLNEVAFQNINLSPDKTDFLHHVEPTLAMDGDTVYVGYKNAATHDGGGLAVSYVYSNNSEQWSSPVLMEQFWSTGAGQSDPWMHVFNNTLYYVYLEYPFGVEGQSQMTLARTNDLGNDWNLTRASFGSGFADKETFTIDENGYIYLAYDDVLETHTEMKLSRSFDGGETFIENITMSDGISPNYLAPYIVSAGSGVLYNAFSYFSEAPVESDIFFDKSLDYGETWGLDTDLNPTYNASAFTQGVSGRPSKSTLPAMSVDQNGRIYIAWEDISTNIANRDWDVYMKYSDDMGESWSDRIQINKDVEGNSWMPDIDIDTSGNVYVAYYDDSILGLSNLMYRIYYPSNNTLSAEFRISTESTSHEFTRLGDYVTIRLDDNDKFHVVWTDGRNDVMDIYYASNKLDLVDVTLDSNPISTSTTSSSSTITTTTSSTTPSSSSSSSNSSDTSLLLPFVAISLAIVPIVKKKINIKPFQSL